MRPRPVVGEATVPDAVRRLLDKFDYPDRESPAQIIPILPTLGGGGGAPSIVVAASDASDLSKSKADLVCTGTNDEVVVQAAIDSITKGRVLLTESNFTFGTSTVTVPIGITIAGMGLSTYVYGEAAGFMFDAAALTNFYDIAFENGTTGGGIIDIVGGAGSSIRNCNFEVADATAWMVRKSSTGWLLIDNCWFEGPGEGVITSNNGGRFLHVTNSRFNSTKIGIRMAIGSNWQWYIAGNQFESCDSWGADVGSEGGVITGNIFTNCGQTSDGALRISSGAIISVANNTFASTRNGRDIYILNSRQVAVIGNASEVALLATSIELSGTTGSTVVGNAIIDADYHGIQISGSSDNLIADNLISNPSQNLTNTYDGIILDGNSDRNHIVNNRIIGASAAPLPRYGINISAATCDDNSYLGNRTGPAADYGTGAYNDAGTGTVNTWPGAAAPQGDNLL